MGLTRNLNKEEYGCMLLRISQSVLSNHPDYPPLREWDTVKHGVLTMRLHDAADYLSALSFHMRGDSTRGHADFLTLGNEKWNNLETDLAHNYFYMVKDCAPDAIDREIWDMERA